MLYRPARFEYPMAAAVELVQRLRFGLIVSLLGNEIQFSHVPVLVDVQDGKLVRLRGHFARANPHWKALQENPDAVMIFNGPNAYVSAQWYSKDCPAAPTWNYVVVHVHGKMQLLPEPQDVSDIVDELIRVNEAELPQQWDINSYSPQRRAMLLPHIIGFHLDVTAVEHKFKLNQHYADIDKIGAAKGLLSRGTDATREIAEYMLSTVSASGDKGGVDIAERLQANGRKKG